VSEFLETTYEKFIFKVKVGYLYSQEEFWTNFQNGSATVGLTDFMQKAKGDVAFLETMEPGQVVKRGEEIGKIETIKATFGIISPVSGKVLAVNEAVVNSPEMLNSDPYEGAWLVKIEIANAAEADELMDSATYDQYCEGRH